MATTRTLDRQPTKLDYASPTQLPKVEFFTVTANIQALLWGIQYFPHHIKISLLWEIN